MSFITESLKIKLENPESQHILKKLEALSVEKEVENKNLFFSKINNALNTEDVTDATQIDYHSEIITAFKSEVITEKIETIVTALIQSANNNIDASIVDLKTTTNDINAYINMVSTIIEVSKSFSSSLNNLQFSMNRLSPGIFIFLFASSLQIKNEQLFGNDIVTTTNLHYTLMHSIDDVKNKANFDARMIDINSLIRLKALQAALLDDLANDIIEFETWQKLDRFYTKAILAIANRLGGNLTHLPFLRAIPISKEQSDINKSVIKSALVKLSLNQNTNNAIAIHKTKERLANSHF